MSKATAKGAPSSGSSDSPSDFTVKLANFTELLEEFESVATAIATTASNPLTNALREDGYKYELIEYLTREFGTTSLFKLLQDTTELDLSGVKSGIIIPITGIVAVTSPKLVKIEYFGCYKEAPYILKLLKYSGSLKEVSLNNMGYHYGLNPKILEGIVNFSHPIHIILGQMGISSEEGDDIPNTLKNYNKEIKRIETTKAARKIELLESIKFTAEATTVFNLVKLIGEYDVPDGETNLEMPDYTQLGLC